MDINNYDNAAGFYDVLSRFVFGKSLIRAQQALLTFIKPNSDVLIVGGGTGSILEELAEVHPAGLKITYVEISAKMIKLAQKRDWKQNEVLFLHTAIEEYIPVGQFDVIMTAFLFDNFKEERALKVFKILDTLLHPTGIWLFADFNVGKKNGSLWQKFLLGAMYRFFRILCNIEARQLPDMKALFQMARYNTLFETKHFGDFIESIVFQKPS
jgi:ubiquinone/menaquinone biosynthesis C-methylase UbiE